MVIELGDRHPQAALDAASPGETIVADPAIEHTLDAPLTVTTPRVTLRGPTLRLADDADENLVEIGADGVRLTEFTIDGNRANQHGDRQSNGVVVTGASNVAVTNGHVRDVSRHGLRIVDTSTATSFVAGNTVGFEPGPVSDVTVRDVRVEAPRRDGCSVEGPDLEGVLVENVRTTDSSDRGSVEIKDGAADAVVANCRAERCVYGVAVQDHGEYPTANVRIAGTLARDCETLVDAQTSHPPEDVVIAGNVGRDLGGDGMGGPGGVHAHLIEGLVIANNLLDGVDGPGIAVDDCADAAVTGNVLSAVSGPGIDVAGSDRVSVGDNGLDGGSAPAIRCRGGASELQVSDNRCSAGGISLEGGIDRYLVTSNLLAGGLDDRADGTGLVTDNLA